QAKGRMKRLIREVRVVEAGGLHLLNSKNWGQVMDEVNISSTRWEVADVEQAIKALESPIIRPPQLHLRLQTDLRSGNYVLRSTAMEIGYPGTILFEAEPIELMRGECAALIGPNGTGKTTFLRTLTQQIDPLEGTIRFGASLKVGYFAQAHDKLNPENTVLDELLSHKHMLLGPARNYLAQYLFRGDDVFKRVSMLSGGERARLALAILALDGANFLLLDEPTNHLDIPSQEVLQEVLEHFDGTVLLVSHDRYLIDRLATQIWALRDGKMTVFSGPYTEYVAARTLQSAREKEAVSQERVAVGGDRKSDRMRKNEERKRAQLVAKWEEKVHALETQLEQVEHDLATASQAQNLTQIQQLSDLHAKLHVDLEQAMDKWAAAADGA
ncbi:MAG: ABC-F family ATP-binding cassette domain-containing protein, partial [Caldilineaceae bacterium]|nr:ABC-F family ATP-binding cassette domain-containing protein [Caldilineaceae bacterium]